MAGRGGMSCEAIFWPDGPADSRLAEARERFLTAESIKPGQVRDTILASSWRSREWHVAADRIDLSYVRDPDLDTPLTRSALPVLADLRESLEGQPPASSSPMRMCCRSCDRRSWRPQPGSLGHLWSQPGTRHRRGHGHGRRDDPMYMSASGNPGS